jgi:hypothetical protein
MAKEKIESEAATPGANGAARDPMEQVRELLFGEAKRTTQDHMLAMEGRIEAMRADFLERLAALENRLVDLARETERNQTASVDAIGGAIAQLGASIQNMSKNVDQRRKGG